MNQYRWHARLAEEVAAETPGCPPITVLRDGGDDAAVTHALLDTHDLSRGVITVHPTPATISGLALAADVLAVLGCSSARTVPEKVAAVEPASRAVLAWLYAHRIRHLVILRTHTLTTDQVAWLLRLRRSGNLHLVLVWHSPQPIRWGAVEVNELPHHLTEDLDTALGEILGPTTVKAAAAPTADSRDLPQVPDTGAGTFRSDAAARLTPGGFERVDAVYTRAVDTTCAWIAERTGRSCENAHADGGDGLWFGAGDAVVAERILEALHGRHARLRTLYEQRPDTGIANWVETLALYRLLAASIADSPGANTTVTRLRGVQTALALHGVDLELPPNLAYSVGPGLTSTLVDQDVADRIRAHTVNPAYAAAAAVQLFTGATLKELKAIPCVAFAIDALIYASPIGIADPAPLCVWPVPPAARPLLEAAWLFQTTRPEPSDKLLTGGIGALGQILRDTLTSAGLITPARHGWHYGWLWQTGTLWCGRRPTPPKRKHQFRRNEPTFQRRVWNTGEVPIEERAPFPERRALQKSEFAKSFADRIGQRQCGELGNAHPVSSYLLPEISSPGSRPRPGQDGFAVLPAVRGLEGDRQDCLPIRRPPRVWTFEIWPTRRYRCVQRRELLGTGPHRIQGQELDLTASAGHGRCRTQRARLQRAPQRPSGVVAGCQLGERVHFRMRQRRSHQLPRRAVQVVKPAPPERDGCALGIGEHGTDRRIARTECFPPLLQGQPPRQLQRCQLHRRGHTTRMPSSFAVAALSASTWSMLFRP
nr:hypothetical protein [Nocardia fusca]